MISRDICRKVLQKAVSTGGDYAEVFAENTANHTISMIASKVDAIKDAVIAGAAVRVYKGMRSVMATTVDTSESGLMRCAEQAAEALGQGTAEIDIVLKERIFGDIHPVRIVPSTVDNREKVAILKEGYFAAKEYSEAITQVSGSLLDVDHNILIANTEGLYTQDRQIRTRIAISAVAEVNGETQTGSCAPGRRMGLEMFELIDPKATGIHAAKQAVTMAGAGYCPAGVMPVAIDNGFGGVIFHEACGHSLEASSVAYGRSQFVGKLGQQIANVKVTAIDDGTIPNAWGSINIDDEGTPAQKNVLIENGVLKSYMVDKFNGRRMGMASTGEFNFAVNEGYIVRNGKICEPVRGASLVGKGSEIIQNIDMVGTNMEMGQGMCGSSSGSVPTNVGQPLIRVSSITVGGR